MLVVGAAIGWGKAYADHNKRQQPVGFVDRYGLDATQNKPVVIIPKDSSNPLLDGTFHAATSVATVASNIAGEIAREAKEDVDIFKTILKVAPYLAMAYIGLYAVNTLKTR